MLSEQFGWLIVVFTVIGYYFYFKDFFYGKTRPNLVTWFIWMLAPFIGFFLQLKAGATWSTLPVFIAGFGPLLVLIVSLIKKNGYWKITTFDLFCGFISLVALLIYVLTHNSAISIIFAILSDLLAGIPTFVKSWKFPETETGILYFSGVVINVIGLLIIKNWDFTIYSFSIYIIVMNLLLMCVIYRKRLSRFFSKK